MQWERENELTSKKNKEPGGYILKKIILSDHITERLDEMYRGRETRYASGMETYNNETRGRQEKIEKGRGLLKEAWDERRPLKVIRYAFEYLKSRMTAKPVAPVMELPDSEERRYLSGREGEMKVDEHLGRLLGDEWTVIAGYRNFKGEIDRILVGPPGIFATEVKNVNGRISRTADVWMRNRYDGRGRLTGDSDRIADGKEDGRNRCPDRQLNEPADVLERYLGRIFPGCRIHRTVVFTHERSRLGSLEGHNADEVVLLGDWNLEGTFQKSAFRMTEAEVEKAVQKIQQSHRYMDRILRNHGGTGEDTA
jgi:hypothetical protein